MSVPVIDTRLQDYFDEWLDFDAAAFRLGCVLGIFDSDSRMTDHKRVFWSANPLGEALQEVLLALVTAGVLEMREGEMQFRWRGELRDRPPHLT
jgi:hypothetical protein